MKKLFILLLTFSIFIKIESQEKKCVERFSELYNKSLPELIKHNYRNEKLEVERFFIVHEVEFDTAMCIYEFVFSFDIYLDRLIKHKGSFYYRIDSNIIIITEPSESFIHFIAQPLGIINDSVISSFNKRFISMDPTYVYSDHDFWINVKYRYGIASFSICGITPILIFWEDR